jgi:hypothetical protein
MKKQLSQKEQKYINELEAKCTACQVRCEHTKEIMNCDSWYLRDQIEELEGD